MPKCSQAGRTSSSLMRSARLYRHCSDESPRKFLLAAAPFASAMFHAAKFDEPT